MTEGEVDAPPDPCTRGVGGPRDVCVHPFPEDVWALLDAEGVVHDGDDLLGQPPPEQPEEVAADFIRQPASLAEKTIEGRVVFPVWPTDRRPG